MIDEKIFRKAMSSFATGVTVVSMEDEGKAFGMTVNAFMSISLNPKLIAISIDEKASMYSKLTTSTPFGISILKDDQQDVSEICANQREGSVAFIDQGGAPVIEDSLTKLSCCVKDRFIAGDHVIVVAEVTQITLDEGLPLAYFDSQYRQLL